MSEEAINEGDLAVALGVERDLLREARRALAEGTHWWKEHRAVVWGCAGRVALGKWLEERATKNAPQEAGMGADGGKGTPVVESGGEAGKSTGAAAFLGAEVCPPAPGVAARVARVAPARVLRESMVVSRTFGNPRFVEAQRGGGERVRVRVRDATYFIRGMELVAELEPGGRVWAMVGRCPRFRGEVLSRRMPRVPFGIS